VAFDVTVVAQDPYGNTDTNYGGTITWTTTDQDPGVMLPPDYAFQPSDQGMGTFPGGVTLITPGDQLLAATDTANNSITGSTDVIVTSPSAPGRGTCLSGGAPLATAGFGLAPAATASVVPAQAEAATPSQAVSRTDQFFTIAEYAPAWARAGHKANAGLDFVLDPNSDLASQALLTDLTLA
jgi:hypothetical protein